ncbi:hypothetical protein [Calothrix sp. 336/3]|uniref:hypothetical protein n=1 Tax=Calothrix sp. 336/3 TaxID=1337936 RepID=UPI00069C98D8|nr:hypothetical protein [Calothrix sp. 336/3]
MTQEIDYTHICQEFKTEVVDSWQEYTLLRLPIHNDPSHAASIIDGLEATYVLKIICPSSGTIRLVRVPPNLSSATEAATWINQGISPKSPIVEPIRKIQRQYRPEVTALPDDCCHDVHCIFDEDED